MQDYVRQLAMKSAELDIKRCRAPEEKTGAAETGGREYNLRMEAAGVLHANCEPTDAQTA